MSTIPALIRVELLSFTPRKPTSHYRVVGYATVALPDLGLTICDIKLHCRNQAVFAVLPERIVLAGDSPARDEHEKFVYRPIIRFHSDRQFIAFADAVIAAVRSEHPEAFANFKLKQPEMQAAE